MDGRQNEVTQERRQSGVWKRGRQASLLMHGTAEGGESAQARPVWPSCCDCMRQSTCSMKHTTSRDGCACRAVKCVSCTRFGQCRNKTPVVTSTTGTFQRFFNNAVATISGATAPQSTAICHTNFAAESGSSTLLVTALASAASTSVQAAAAPATPTKSQPLSTQPTTPLTVSGHSDSHQDTVGPAQGSNAESQGKRQTQDPSGRNGCQSSATANGCSAATTTSPCSHVCIWCEG